MESKPWYQSKTLIGAAVAILSAILRGVGVEMGDLDESAVTLILDVVGFGLVIYGRVNARQRIGVGPDPKGVGGSLLLLVLLFASSGCATSTGNPVKDARARAVNQLLAEAGKILGDTVTTALFESARAESGEDRDWQQSAAQGLYANMDAARTGAAVQRIVLAYSGGRAAETAVAAKSAFEQAKTNDSAKATGAIAAVVSAAADTHQGSRPDAPQIIDHNGHPNFGVTARRLAR